MKDIKRKIVFLDSDEQSQKVYTSYIEKAGFEPILCSNCLLTLDMLKDHQYAGIIVDETTPISCGFEFMENLKKFNIIPAPFMISSKPNFESAYKAGLLGVLQYWTKPVPEKVFIKQLKDGLEKWDKLKKGELSDHLLSKKRSIEKSRTVTLLSCMSEGILATDSAGNISLINPAAAKMLRFHDIKVVGKHYKDLINQPELEKGLAEILGKKDTNIRVSQSEMILHDGRIVRANISPIVSGDGEYMGTVSVLVDISHEKHNEQVKSDFVSFVAHELKAPVAAIEGYLNLLIDGVTAGNPEKEKNIIDRCRIRAENLLLLINDLLDLSRADRQMSSKQIKTVNLEAMVQDTIEFYQNQADEKNIKVQFVKENNIPTMRGVQEDLSRMVANLVSNAIKYTPKDGYVTITLCKPNSHLSLQVKDTGIGISKSEIPKLFNQFFRAENAVAQKISGTGLGLAIAKKIIEDHNGYIDVESEVNKGTLFTIVLPLIKE